MRLSEFSTGNALDVVCEVMPYIGSIVSDEELVAEIKEKVKATGNESVSELFLMVADKIYKIAPILLKKHREDVYHVLAAMNGKSIEDIDTQNVMITLLQVRDILKDKELVGFFRSSGTSEPTK